MAGTTLWISGATYGIGAGLAKHAPYAGARIVNLDVNDSPDYETVRFDLTRPETWEAVRRHFERELSGFRGERAIFLVVGHALLGHGLADRVDPDEYRTALIANGVGPLLLATYFYRALAPGYESGLMVMSSGAGGRAFVGQSMYGAAKAGIEHWCRVLRAEIAVRGWGPWVVAVRPGMVATPSVRAFLDADTRVHPRRSEIAKNLEKHGRDVDEAARLIWAALPPKEEDAVISFDRVLESA
jgi:NAD(P)-dependent dehydrogenase (short-subunit alcohol dehydrogenase family)